MSNRFSIWMGLSLAFLLAGCITTEIDDRPRASTYGMQDPALSVLVIRDNSAGFSIASVALKGVDVAEKYTWGAAPEYEDTVYEIHPGHYTITFDYYSQSGTLVCQGSVMGEFTVAAGLAVGYSMANGSIEGCSAQFDPPEAIDITSSLEKPDPPIVIKSINRTGTLCILTPVILGFLILIIVIYLSWRNQKIV